MIRITHLNANLPFDNCSVRFMAKCKNKLSNQPSVIPLKEEFIDISLNETMQVSNTNGQNEISLCVLALTEDSKVYVGHIDIRMDQQCNKKKQNLKGLLDQHGFIEYSVQLYGNEPIFDQIQLPTETVNEFKDEKSVLQEIPKLQESEIKSMSENERVSNMIEDIKMMILEEALKNQQYKNRLNQNQIFQLRNKERIERLISYHE